MRHRVGSSVLAALVGFLGGYVARGAPALPGVEPTQTTEAARPAPAPHVCLRPAEEPGIGDDLRLRWCEAQLGRAQERIHGQRLAWPEGDLGAFGPAVFHESLEEAVRGCDVEVIATECTEFPCMGVLRSAAPRELAERCPGLERLFGEDAAPHLSRMPCPDGGSVLVPLVWGIDDTELLAEHVRPLVDTADDSAFADWHAFARVAGRRFDDALSLAGELCDDHRTD